MDSGNNTESKVQQKEEQVKEVKLVDVPIDSPNTALNVLVSFLNLAQKRGAFGMDESAKIWECVKAFQQ
tara:strand:- start:828 stop:1034 length:207 start_codon:yes stop_codon:yes gene_type:complete